MALVEDITVPLPPAEYGIYLAVTCTPDPIETTVHVADHSTQIRTGGYQNLTLLFNAVADAHAWLDHVARQLRAEVGMHVVLNDEDGAA